MKMTLIGFLSITLVLANDTSFERWGSYLKNDFNKVQTTVTTNTLIYTGIGLAGLYGLSWYDQELTHDMQDQYHGRCKNFLDITNELGNAWYIIPGSALVTGISILTDSRKFQDAAFTSLQSLLIAGSLTGIIKLTVGRLRPESERGPYHFKPLSGNVSFPSGHATTAFALITPWVLNYPHPFTYALFALPAGTALARMAKDKHWATDVLTGSFIGFAVTLILHKWHVTAYQDSCQNNKRINFNIAL